MQHQLAVPKALPACDIASITTRANPSMLTIAHRGFWRHTAENSAASVRAAIARGLGMVEIDTQSTADGRLVALHDRTLDRTTTGTGTVGELPFHAVRAAMLRSGAGGDLACVTRECVPTLEDILEEARGRIAVNIDTKFPRDLPQVVRTVLDLGMETQVLIKTQIDPDAQRFPLAEQPWFGRIPHMPMLDVRPGRFAEDLRRIAILRPPMVEVRFEDPADISAARAELEQQDIRVWVNTLDVAHSGSFSDARALKTPDAVWGALVQAGVGAIQTDEIDAFEAWLARPQTQGSAQ